MRNVTWLCISFQDNDYYGFSLMIVLQGLAGSKDLAFESSCTETAHVNSVTEYCWLVTHSFIVLCTAYVVSTS